MLKQISELIDSNADGQGLQIPDHSSRICNPFCLIEGTDHLRGELTPLEVDSLPQRFKVYEAEYPYFITSAIVHWIPVFCRDDYFAVLADSLTYCSVHKGLRVHCYVIMPNHFHTICSVADGSLPDVIRDLKKHTSKLLAGKLEEDRRNIWLTAMRRAGGTTSDVKIWDDTYYPEQVRTSDFFNQKLDYIHNNPVRAGFIANPAAWKYSSAGFYYREDESVVPIVPLMW